MGWGLDTPIPKTTHKTGIFVSEWTSQQSTHYRQMFPVTLLALLSYSILGDDWGILPVSLASPDEPW